MKFRKKPVVVDAVQVTDEWFDGDHPNPLHPISTPEGPLIIDSTMRQIRVGTLEGIMIAHTGDWIITGVKGEHYPCKPDIFEMTYEPVPDKES